MNWLKYLRRWLPASSGLPAPPRSFADPLEYLLAASLGHRAVSPAELQALYPGLVAARAEAIQEQLAQLQEQAMDLGRLVNQGQLGQAAAYERMWQAYPQLDRQHLGRLLWQAFVATR